MHGLNDRASRGLKITMFQRFRISTATDDGSVLRSGECLTLNAGCVRNENPKCGHELYSDTWKFFFECQTRISWFFENPCAQPVQNFRSLMFASWREGAHESPTFQFRFPCGSRLNSRSENPGVRTGTRRCPSSVIRQSPELTFSK